MQTTKDEVRLRFLRITLLGPSSAGKTALINCYVNSNCPHRYVRTEKAMVYHKKVDINDEGNWTTSVQPIFVELEDTPGSERGNDEDNDDRPRSNDFEGEPKPRVGARVILEKDKNRLIASFEEFKTKTKTRMRYRPAMDGMLGKEFTVKHEAPDGSFGLPSPDGSEGGVWQFPPSVISLKLALTLPIDEFLSMAEKKKPEFHSQKETKKYNHDLKAPMQAYNRPIGPPDMDKTLTRNRMGYFICFDLSDEDGESLKEAMMLNNMLQKAMADKKKAGCMKPIIFFVGCKADKASEDAMAMNRDSGHIWSEQQEIPMYVTSARTHKGVHNLFDDMLQAISSRENLWSLLGEDNEDEADGDEPAGCSLQ